MKRFDQGLQSAKDFIDGEMGGMLAFKAWYCDSTHRYAMTDAVQPLIVKSAASAGPTRPERRSRAILHAGAWLPSRRYGAISVWRNCRGAGAPSSALRRPQLVRRCGVRKRRAWPSRPDGCRPHGLARGLSALWREWERLGRTFNPWLFRSSEVDIFREATGSSSRILGADGHFYRRQLESFADSVLNDTPVKGADVTDGVASVRAMLAIRQSARTGRPVKLCDVSGAV